MERWLLSPSKGMLMTPLLSLPVDSSITEYRNVDASRLNVSSTRLFTRNIGYFVLLQYEPTLEWERQMD